MALGGRSSRTYRTQGLWDQTLALMKPGDFVLIQFGHNDGAAINDDSRARGTIRGVGDESVEIDNLITKQHEVVRSYGWYMRRYLAEAQAKGVTPIVCSLVPRKIWKDGRVVRGAGDYAGWAAEAARAEGAAFIDLNEIVARRYEELGPERVGRLFADEHTHTTAEGAEINAAAVVAGLKGLKNCAPCRYLSAKAAGVASFTGTANVSGLPRIEKRGQATQLIVDGQPFLPGSATRHSRSTSRTPPAKASRAPACASPRVARQSNA